RALSRRLSAPGRNLHGRQQGFGRRDGALGMGARLLALFERQIPRRRDRGAQRQARPVGGRVRRAATLASGASTAGVAALISEPTKMLRTPIIFLDVDGVLNHRGVFRPGNGPDPLCPKAVRRLIDLVAVAGARIVVSSTWRLGGIDSGSMQ